jgi:hypothetical protein
MAVVFTVVKRGIAGNQRRVIVDVTGPASYTTGGEALTLAQFQFLFPDIASNATAADWTKATFVDVETSFSATPAFLSGMIDKVGGKFVYTTAGAQTANATNLSAAAQTIRMQIMYAGSVG